MRYRVIWDIVWTQHCASNFDHGSLE